mmetsp:Transcript_7888/g.17187  ORF Transcript_7888/g.17187 Transcript_7888/m.17187 type:complete len:213 (-) Transcript_7888:597-1235(-)
MTCRHDTSCLRSSLLFKMKARRSQPGHTSSDGYPNIYSLSPSKRSLLFCQLSPNASSTRVLATAASSRAVSCWKFWSEAMRSSYSRGSIRPLASKRWAEVSTFFVTIEVPVRPVTGSSTRGATHFEPSINGSSLPLPASASSDGLNTPLSDMRIPFTSLSPLTGPPLPISSEFGFTESRLLDSTACTAWRGIGARELLPGDRSPRSVLQSRP